jgi:hypothetical protein
VLSAPLMNFSFVFFYCTEALCHGSCTRRFGEYRTANAMLAGRFVLAWYIRHG